MEAKRPYYFSWVLILVILILSACSSNSPSPKAEDPQIDNLAVQNWFGDNDPGVTYSADWSYVKSSQYADGDTHVSSNTSANLSFNFSGTSLSLYANKSKNAGKFKVYIDGAYKQEVDLYSSWLSTVYNQQVFSTNVPTGSHSVKIVHSGSKHLFSKGYEINLDRIKIAGKLLSAPPSLKTVSVPDVSGLSNYIVDKSAASALGKAFFWDMAAGSDGQACASCHFNAGIDNRIKNQLSPGLNAGDTSFQQTASGGKGGPNYSLKLADFPLHKLSDPANPYSSVIFNTNDTISSQGVFLADFKSLPDLSVFEENCDGLADPIFHIGSSNTRQVEPRNTPTMINAALNFRNFWDGRANNVFNGVDPFGKRNSSAKVMAYNGSSVSYEGVDLRNSALASQAVGPAVSTLEMACINRKFADLGKKLIERQPLAFQSVHSQDSSLASYRSNSGKGLNTTYRALIQKAFNSKYWSAPAKQNGYSQMENNFSLFWALALQAYQDTLISDEAPYDSFAEGNKAAIGDAEKRGLELFIGKAHCIACHTGPEFTSAATSQQQENKENGLVERMYMGNGGLAIYDRAFYNIGVTPTKDDLGVGAKDPFGNPLSFSRQYISGKFVDPIKVDPCTFDVPFSSFICGYTPWNVSSERVAVDGAFKVPSLRNVELTGPYFHNGSTASLEQVVEFYNRGGNFRDNPELDPDIQPLGLSTSERAELVAFLKSLTDPRVKNEAGPFDHPQLFIPNGHEGNETSVSKDGKGRAKTEWLEVPAVGKYGRSNEGLVSLKDFVWTLNNGGPNLLKAAFPGSSPMPTPSPEIKNLLLNGDFETDLSNWSIYDSTVSLSSDALSGSKALKMTAYGWLQQDIGSSSLTVGKTYTLSVSAKSPGGQTCTVGFSGAGFSTSLSFSSSSYSQKSTTQILPTGANWAAIYLASDSGTCLFDDISLSSN